MIFMPENAFENVVCKMAAILFRLLFDDCQLGNELLKCQDGVWIFCCSFGMLASDKKKLLYISIEGKMNFKENMSNFVF